MQMYISNDLDNSLIFSHNCKKWFEILKSAKFKNTSRYFIKPTLLHVYTLKLGNLYLFYVEQSWFLIVDILLYFILLGRFLLKNNSNISNYLNCQKMIIRNLPSSLDWLTEFQSLAKFMKTLCIFSKQWIDFSSLKILQLWKDAEKTCKFSLILFVILWYAND